VANTASNADLATDGGNTNHDHTHAAHTHTFSGSSLTGVATTSGSRTVAQTHSHGSATSNSSTITVDTTTNDFLRVEVIYIESDGTPTGMPDGCFCMFRSDTLPTNWTRRNGDGYFKGAGTGADGSGTPTGANTHTHTNSSHAHAAKNSAAGSASNNVNIGDNLQAHATSTHNHSISLNANTTTFSTETAEPEFRDINIIENEVGATDFPDQVVAFWNGTHAGVPTDWARLTDWDNKFVKGANANGESDVSTGGGTAGHTHTQTHNHGSTDNGVNGSVNADSGIGLRGIRKVFNPHTHSSWTIGNDTTATGTSSSEAHYPKTRRLILVEWTDPDAGVSRRVIVSSQG